uniref:Protein MON2 homolog isoform X1 n=1 Tax=Rhizophora mucronata TaxID=61149 RepID=A0A2P2MTT3_RHIMU
MIDSLWLTILDALSLILTRSVDFLRVVGVNAYFMHIPHMKLM